MSIAIIEAALVLLLAGAGLWDAVKLRIPNVIVLSILLLFAAFVAMTWQHMPILMHLASGALVLAAALLMYSRRLWGAGDAKLAFAGALWIPLGSLPMWLLVMVLSGGVLTMLLLIGRRAIPSARAQSLPEVLRRRGPIPYGIAIAIGTLVAAVPLQSTKAPNMAAPPAISDMFPAKQ